MIVGIHGGIGEGKDTFANMFIKHAPQFENKKFADKLKDIICLLINCSRDELEDREFKEKPLGKDWWYYKSGEFIYPLGHFSGVDEKIANERFLVKPTPRLLMQLLGTEAGRKILHPSIWINSLFADYVEKAASWDCDGNTTSVDYPYWIISDLRFINEFAKIKDRGGVNILIQRSMSIKEWLGESLFQEDILNLTAISDDNINNVVTKQEMVTLLSKHNEMQKLLHPSERELYEAYINNQIVFDYVIDNDGTLKDLEDKVKILTKEVLKRQ